MTLPPDTEKMNPGGPYGNVECTRCSKPATRTYEGNAGEFLSLCENCWIALGSFLHPEEEVDDQ